ncbi:threonine/serine ThrE exporter family protein [Microbacterium ulmi]|uniref:Threonine/serine exporter family protein n=1 Tax=Microbacterium ulmi TaxID=179095 RepID=A0A7Y2M1B8_9MICO|nr:threonine/serine exporter family protein [Microbacterium ulmi]NII70569.1 uncharacterized membrane protein YjjP (DUF1212 family) [Microbacterium ulmi]NNH04189.1 threonine/serine exporter family protein [Microbacterium ulmi]
MTGLLDRVRAAVGALRRRSEPAPRPDPDTAGVPEMLGAVGTSMLASTQATNDVEDTLHQLSRAYDRPDLRTFVLPTLVLVEDPSTTPAHTAIFPAEGTSLRLDQAGGIERLIGRAVDTRMPPRDVVAEAARIRAAPPRFPVAVTILGHTILTLGFGMVLNPTATALPVYVVLGAIVGAIVVFGARVATLSLLLPVFTAFAVTSLTAWLVVPFVDDDPLRLVAPALVSFLPGLTLTVAAVELTSSQVIAGASRMVYGVAQLGLLAFGVFGAITVVGIHVPAATPDTLGWWAPWVGIVLTSAGFALFSVAPRGAIPWILSALVVAYAAQLAGNALLGAELSGFVGAAAVVPAVHLVRRIRTAPPSAVMLTCAYWLLVPGALGFIGITEVAAGAAGALDTVVQTFVSLVAIAIGMMVGAGFSRDMTAVTRAWRHPPSKKRS